MRMPPSSSARGSHANTGVVQAQLRMTPGYRRAGLLHQLAALLILCGDRIGISPGNADAIFDLLLQLCRVVAQLGLFLTDRGGHSVELA